MLQAAVMPGLPIRGSGNQEPENIQSVLADLPSEFGIFRDSFFPKGSSPSEGSGFPMILHIQDAHANVEAQSRIRDILGWLDELIGKNPGGGHLVIALEGTTGDLHPEYFDLFPHYEKANQAVVENLFHKGEVTGAELFSWEHYLRTARGPDKGENEAVRVVTAGVETPELFRDNLKILRDLMMKREEIENLLKPIASELTVLSSRILNPELRDFIRDSERAEILPSPILRHIRETLGVDLNDRLEQIRFPNLARIVHLQEVELFLDPELARLEWQNLKPRLAAAGCGDAELTALGSLTGGETSGGILPLREIFGDLLSKSPNLQETLSKYPHYMQAVSYRLLSQEIDSRGFVLEIESLKSEIMKRLARNDRERQYLQIYHAFEIYQKTLRAELTREEYEKLQAGNSEGSVAELMEAMADLAKGDAVMASYHEASVKNREALNGFYASAMEFYGKARLRDEALLKNTLALYKLQREAFAEKEAEAEGAWIVVLISGGFHSDGMAESMKRVGIPHMVITPRISKMDKENLYARVIRRENADLGNYFDRHSLDKQESLLFRGLVEQAAPVLTEEYGVAPELIPESLRGVLESHPVLSRKLRGTVFQENEKGREIAALRIGIESAPVSRSVDAETIGEVGVLTDAARYSYLSSEEIPPQGAGTYGTVRLDFPLSGHAQVLKESAPGQIFNEIFGSVQATAGQLDQGTLKVLASAHEQFRNLANTGIFNTSITGVGAQSMIRQRRRPERAAVTPPVQVVPPAPGLGQLVTPEAPASKSLVQAVETVKSELREAEPSVLGQLEMLQASFQGTETFRKQFADFQIPDTGKGSELDELLTARPDLQMERQLMGTVSDMFYDPDLLIRAEKLETWRFLQHLLVTDRKPEESVPEALELVREALGPYAWFLDQKDGPLQIILRAKRNQPLDNLLRIAAILSYCSPGMELDFVMDGTPEDARRAASLAADIAAKLKLSPQRVLQQVRFISSGGELQEAVRAVKQIRSHEKNLYAAVVDPSQELLERVGYIPRLARIRHEKVEREAAFMITVALLRQVADQYDIVRLEDLMTRFDINLSDLVDRVAQVIRVLNHLATQA